MVGPPASVYLVLFFGNLGGGVVKGITGFGSAIINLLVWVLCTCVGINAGSLQQAVLTECLACWVVGIPLLVMTKAHRTADWRLVVSLSLFAAAGSPLGVAMLTQLNPRIVELVMGCMLLVVIATQVDLHQKAKGWYALIKAKLEARRCQKYSSLDADVQLKQLNSHHTTRTVTSSPPHWQPDTSEDDVIKAGPSPRSLETSCHPLSQPDGCTVVVLEKSCEGHPPPVAIILAPAVDSHSPHTADSNAQLSNLSSQPLVICQPVAAALTCSPAACECGQSDSTAHPCNPEAKALCTASCRCSMYVEESTKANIYSQEGDTLWPLQCCGTTPFTPITLKQTPPLAACGDTSLQEKQPLVSGMPNSSSDVDPELGEADKQTHPLAATGLRGIWSRWLAKPGVRECLHIFMLGSVAGTLSGVMGGMTGIAGPPIMYMYTKLNVAKATVRGTNAFINVLQFRIITYIVMKVFQEDYLYAYLLCAAAGLIGTFFGNFFAGKMDQKSFSRTLVVLMVVCCILMFGSAAGLAEAK